ncbi:glycosyltransferase [Pseudomonas viridiflava]|uniref:glycosyltransferase n=1 Tax=Pseudomonas viridiflava TaxID=33069 RepID=UPI000F0289CF|nr:glycosyltransferase [Pseudomonas viridiflava]
MCSDPPRVAVLLAAYNGMSWLEEQLETLQKQIAVAISIFISVDISTDGTEAWCTTYAQLHANTTLLAPAGQFGAAAANFFRLIRDVDFSGFDYVAFSDQDDLWYPDKLHRAVSKLNSSDHDAYSSNIIAFWPNGRRRLLNKAQPQVRWDYLFEAAGPGCTYVITRRLANALKASIRAQWDLVKRIDLHDWYCYAFARTHGFKWFIDPVPGLDYRQHDHNQIGANAGLASFRPRFNRIIDNWWSEQVMLIRHLAGNGPMLMGEKSKRLWFLGLIPKAGQCRRRTRDKFLFVIVCFVIALKRQA